jgi:hypothetical protein
VPEMVGLLGFASAPVICEWVCDEGEMILPMLMRYICHRYVSKRNETCIECPMSHVSLHSIMLVMDIMLYQSGKSYEKEAY